jgi:hypothetical protein
MPLGALCGRGADRCAADEGEGGRLDSRSQAEGMGFYGASLFMRESRRNRHDPADLAPLEQRHRILDRSDTLNGAPIPDS